MVCNAPVHMVKLSGIDGACGAQSSRMRRRTLWQVQYAIEWVSMLYF